MYKLYKDVVSGNVSTVLRLADNSYIPFDPNNTDYAKFKANILANKAELQDADGNTMTPEQAKAYIEELP